MAQRARLVPPRESRTYWPWHDVEWSSVRASSLSVRERRLEAANILAGASATRAAIESQQSGWARLSDFARVWQPSRLKGIQVESRFGTPFLTAGQMYDVRPVARKWLSLNRTPDSEQRIVSEGAIVVTCSGNVGRATVAHAATAGVLVSHDLLRVEPKSENCAGWLYAYLRAPTVRRMMKSTDYGQIVKHLETQHLDELPVVFPPDVMLLRECDRRLRRIIACRNEAVHKNREAETLFGNCFPGLRDTGSQAGFVVSARDKMFGSRRRFDAWYHNPRKEAIERCLRQYSREWVTLEEAGCDIWLPNRFRRIPAESGALLVDSSQIFEINPDYGKRISPSGISDKEGGTVQPGWLMMARSGQIYGLIGSVALATELHRGKVVSDHVTRIVPGGGLEAGYVYVAMGHPVLGRWRVKALAWGSSVPCIEVEDLRAFGIPRLDSTLEREISKAASEAFALWMEADQLEEELASMAEEEVEEFARGVRRGGPADSA